MALSTPSSSPKIQENSPLISSEAQERVNTVANDAIAVLNENNNAQRAVKKLFGEMVTGNLRDPESVGEIQDGLYEARDARLAKSDPIERLSILKSFSTFMKGFTEGIAQMNRDVSLSDQANSLKIESDKKIAGVLYTYKNILKNSHPTFTAT